MQDKPIIILDVDGVLVSWQSGLPFFCAANNLCTKPALDMLISEEFKAPSEIFGVNSDLALKLMVRYNESKYIRYLSAYPDAIEFIKNNKHKYDFIACTALSSSDQSIMNRLFNLNTMFPNAFIDVRSCNFGESKTDMFKDIKKVYDKRIVAFVDDLCSNIDDCYNVYGDDIRYYQIQRSKHFKRPISDKSHWVLSSLDLVAP